MIKKDSLKTPPNNIEAEESILSTIIANKDSRGDIIQILKPEDFYKPDHQAIFKCVLDLYDDGSPIDTITIYELLKKKKSKISPSLIAKITSNPIASDHIEYANIIKEKSTLRQLIETTNTITGKCYAEVDDIKAILDYSQQEIFNLSSNKDRKDFFKDIKDLSSETINYLQKIKANQNKITGLQTGFIDLDNKTAGLQNSDLIIIAARPGMGKTSFALNLARNVAILNEKKVAFFSLEMPFVQLGMRLLSSESTVDYHKIRTGHYSSEEFNSLTDAADTLSKTKLFIDDSTNISTMEIRTKTRKLAMEEPLGLIIVDYIQLMKTRSNAERRDLEVAEISRNLKAFAKEMDIPIIALAQLNRMPEQRSDKRPILSDLRESGSLEQDADIVMFIHRQEIIDKKEGKKDSEERNEGEAKIIIAKHRNGPTGDIEMFFHKQTMSFRNLVKSKGYAE